MACIKDYMLNRRGVSGNRVIMVKGGFRQKPAAELWLVHTRRNLPKPTPTVAARDVRFKKAKLKDWRHLCGI
ncbi:MAG TPA: hypothetical protein VGV59_05780 [Pyrinomonadaceae bacterium]|nr:hypothetical protein [Pyrinomonadaceae bacterium]